MAQSTEDYLDSLLRKAMGIPDPEPEPDPEPVFETEPVAEPESVIETEPVSVAEPAFEPEPVLEQVAEAESVSQADFPIEDGTAFTSDLASQFFESDQPFSEDFVRPEVDPVPEESMIIPQEMQMTDEGQKILDETFGPIEEPIIEEPIIEQPVFEEPIIEEPVMEEAPVEEAAPSISIDDLDPADANKALDPDMIAALFASANAGDAAPAEEPAIEEPAIEEPAIEEPTIEEPVIEEPVMEEAPVEETAPSISIDDLDPADANKALDPDMIAALFASANAGDAAPTEEPVAEEPAIEESAIEESAIEEPAPEESILEDAPLEDIIPEESAPEEPVMDPADLFDDEEITNLLDSLESMENGDTSAQDQQAGIDGIDFGDVDLGSMLDSVNAEVESDAAKSDADDFSAADLNDLLNSIDGDSDISDIGDMLSKDENSELLEPSAEEIFSSDSDDVLFDIDNVIDEEEEEEKKKKKAKKGKKDKKAKGGKKDKKKKKKKGGLFSFLKKKSDGEDEDVTPIPDDFDGEVAIDPENWDINDNSSAEEEKKGFFARLFEKLFEEVDDDADLSKLIEESAVDVAKEGAEVNEQLLKEGGDKDKKKKKEKKKKEKPKKEKPKKEPKPKKEKKPKEPKEPEEPTKKLPKKKVILIFILCFSLGFGIYFATTYIPYSTDLNNAKKYFASGDYEKTYESLLGHDLSEENQKLHDQAFILYKMQRFYDSYLNYMKMGFKLEALNALVQGVQAMDDSAQLAYDLGVGDQFMALAADITNALENSFGVSVEQARSWYSLEGSQDYTKALTEFINGGNKSDEEGDAAVEPQEATSEVMSAEENDL